ncbi:type IV toxin-antitoxin system AbiEi family antitoxin [Legionella sp. CNM-1927-20]|uniref:type IV toxin-antitoxin system AbiEi family antitoxin n=1 Tax=Legionella sp. CNM-1927-20 TaxID=3422221 RepID=UPI00403B088C
MDTEKLLSTIKNKLGVECKYDKRSNQLNIRIQQNNLTFKPEIIGNIDKSNIGVITHYLQHLNKKSILITNHVNKVLAEKLQEANIEYIDLSGNMFINTAPIFISIKGETPQKSTIADTQHFSLSVASIKIIFTLLTIKSASDRTYREIAKMSDVALGSIGKTFLMLEKNGYLITKNHDEKRLINKEVLLNKWCIGYTERLRPKLIMQKFSTDNLALLKEVNPMDFNFLWGGEIAAAKLTNYLKPETITLYADDELPLLQYKCRLKRNINGNIELLKKFWNFDTKTYEQNIVPFILVYADLLSSSDERNQETAEIIYDKFIKKQME